MLTCIKGSFTVRLDMFYLICFMLVLEERQYHFIVERERRLFKFLRTLEPQRLAGVLTIPKAPRFLFQLVQPRLRKP